MKHLSCVLIAFKILSFKIFKYSTFKFNFLRVWYSWREAVKHCLSEGIVTMLSQSDSHVIWIHKGKVPTLGNKLFRCSKGPQVKSTVTELWPTHGFQPSGLRCVFTGSWATFRSVGARTTRRKGVVPASRCTAGSTRRGRCWFSRGW